MKRYTVLLTFFLLFDLLCADTMLAQWQQLGGPHYNAVQAILVDGPNLYAATLTNGVFRSTDRGSTWTSIGVGGPYALAAVPQRSGGTHLFVGGYSYGVYRWDGTGWRESGPRWVNALAVMTPANGGSNDTSLLAGVWGTGIYKTTDDGATWASTDVGVTNKYVRALLASGTALFAACDLGVFRSTNHGASWVQANSGLTSTYVRCFAAAGNSVIAGTPAGVYRSTDNGVTWSSTNSGLSNLEIYALSTSGSTLFVGTNGGVFRSTNNGSNWSAVNTGLASLQIRSLAVTDTGIFAGTCDSRLFRSSLNSIYWTSSGHFAEGQGVASVTALARVPLQGSVGDTALFAGTMDNGVFCSTDDGVSWTDVNCGLLIPSARDMAVVGSSLFVANWDEVLRTTNNGTSWQDVRPVESAFNCLASMGSHLYLGTDYGSRVWHSTDNGATWVDSSYRLGPGIGYFLRCLTAYDTNAFAGTFGGDVYRMRLDLSGPTRCRLVDTLDNSIRAMAFLESDLFAASDTRGVFRSIDRGAHWTYVGFVDTAVFSLKSIGSDLIAGTHFGAFVSRNRGASWRAANDGLTVTVTSLAANATYLFAATGDGVYRRPLTEILTAVSESRGNGTPSGFMLAQNYPNPFNPTTVVSWQLPVVSDVRLVVYDILGQEVAVLVDERKAPGSYDVRFDATGLASGVYFYRLTAGRYVGTRKMLLLR